MAAEPGDLEPEFLWVAVGQLAGHALVKGGSLVGHSAPNFIDSVIVAITQEVVVGNEPVQRLPHHVDVDDIFPAANAQRC